MTYSIKQNQTAQSSSGFAQAQLEKKVWDVIVIGGGAAGMLAAGRAAESGSSVLLLEKNESLGKKLLITGGGRCNITNAEFNTHELISRYGKTGRALHNTFSRFSVADTFTFFESRGLPLKIEAEKRAFPVSDSARDVWSVLQRYLAAGNVVIRYAAAVTQIAAENNIVTVVHTSREQFFGKKIILATGGKSRPETGSTGDGFIWLQQLGHTIEFPEAALVPIKITEPWVHACAGISFQNAELRSYQWGKRQSRSRGKLLFTHFGLSGPVVLNMSKFLTELHGYGPVQLEIDIHPEVDHSQLDLQIRELFQQNANKQVKNSLGSMLPPRIIKPILTLADIGEETPCHSITKVQRKQLVQLLKALPMSVAGFLGTEKAIITSGGVAVAEIDFKTMQSKLFPNLYLVGDVLNLDRPSGGYSLQICWATGYVAGSHAAQNL